MADNTEKLVAKTAEPAFYSRVLFLALMTAQDVAAEDPETADHEIRASYANRIFRGEESASLLAAHVIAANPTIQATIIADNEPPDNDIQFVLASIWTGRAKAFS